MQVRIDVVRIERQRALELLLAPGEVPVIPNEHQRHRRVRGGERVVERQRALRGLAHARHGLARRHVQVREVVVRIGQTCVRQRVGRIAFDCPVEVIDSAADRLFVVIFRLEVTSFEVELERLAVLGRPFRQQLFLLTSEARAQLRGDLLRQLLLQRDHVGDFAVVLIAPDLRPFLRVGESRAYHHAVAALRQLTGDDAAHLELAADGDRIDVALVAKHRAARHHVQLRQLREAVDHAVADAVAEVLDVRIVRDVDERQHGHGVDAIGVNPQFAHVRNLRSGGALISNRFTIYFRAFECFARILLGNCIRCRRCVF